MQNRDTVFVSYSHHDASTKDRLEPALRSTIDEALWVDEHRIEYGDKFDDNIRDALERSLAGVLLISQHFFDSEYIRTKELPFLVEQAERYNLDLGIVYLTAVPKKPLNVTVRIDGNARTIRLDKTYHSFTTPDKPLDKLNHAEQSDIFADIANWAERKTNARALPVGAAKEGAAIAVRMRRHGSQWDRVFVLPDRQRPTPPRSESMSTPFRPKGATGDTLFSALFGNDRDYQGDLFRHAFGSAFPVEPTYGGLRVHLLLEDSSDGNELAVAPWSTLSWQGRALAECGWSVELRPSTPRVEYPDPVHHTMEFPDRVVALVGDGFVDSSHLAEDLRRFFDRYWQTYVPFDCCANAAEFETALNRSPRLVYYFGPADDKGLRLSGDTLLEWSTLAEWLGRAGTVSLLYLNLPDAAAMDAAPLGRTLLEKVRAAVLLHCCARELAPQAARNGIEWLRTVLLEGGDPILALHRQCSGPVYAWSRYTRWSVQKPATPDDPDFVNLFLDREKQRRELAGAKHDFKHTNQVGRIHHVVAYGEAGNLAEEFPRAVQSYLREGRDGAELFFMDMIPLDWSIGSDVDAIETAVRRGLAWQPGRGVESAVLPTDSNPGPETFCYIVLHWAPSAPTADADDAKTLIEGVTNWVAVHLTDAIAEAERRAKLNLRVLSIMTVETTDPDELDELAITIEDLQEKTYESPTFHFGELDQLSGVRKPDLNRFFRDEHRCRCADDQRREFPDLLLGGRRELRFDLAVETIRRGYPDNLGGLFEELKTLKSWPPKPELSTDFWKTHDAR